MLVYGREIGLRGDEEYRLYSKKCFNSWDISEIWQQEGLDFADLKYIGSHNLGLTSLIDKYSNLQPKIEHVSHHVWFTDPQKPNEMKPKDLLILSNKIKILNSENGAWSSILWVNTESAIPETIRYAENLGIEIRDIHNENSKFTPVIDHLIATGKYGLSTDIWRVIAVKNHGGFYSDNDYTLYRNIDFLTATYNSFFGYDDRSHRYTGNSIIAAHKNHPILVKAYELLERNVFNQDRPDYIKFPCSLFAQTITATGPTLLTLAIHNSANKDENHDVIFPHGVIFFLAPSYQNPDLALQKYNSALNGVCEDLPVVLDHIYVPIESLACPIGNDAYSGSWIKDDYHHRIPGEQPCLFDEIQNSKSC